MKILYIDPVFGISGDMMISALIDAGLPFPELQAFLRTIPLPLPAMKPIEKTQGVVKGIHLEIEDSHVSLSIRQMEDLIDGLQAEDKVKADAKGMLNIILNAEAKIHGTSRDELHLHELSHVDTLIDLASIAWGIAWFHIDEVYCGPVPLGRGTIRTAHGIIPNPPPVTLEILSDRKVVFLEEPVEMTTPTGATVVQYYAKKTIASPSFSIQHIGYGVGTYKTERPDILRVFLGTTAALSSDEEVWIIETDLDDMEMEYLGVAAQRIRDAGALDVLFYPVYMKKGRLGIRLSISTDHDHFEACIDSLFAETTTFGLRFRKEGRRVLRREARVVKTTSGPVRVKYGFGSEDSPAKKHIEFDDVKRIAEEKGIPYRMFLEQIMREINEDR